MLVKLSEVCYYDFERGIQYEWTALTIGKTLHKEVHVKGANCPTEGGIILKGNEANTLWSFIEQKYLSQPGW